MSIASLCQYENKSKCLNDDCELIKVLPLVLRYHRKIPLAIHQPDSSTVEHRPSVVDDPAVQMVNWIVFVQGSICEVICVTIEVTIHMCNFHLYNPWPVLQCVFQ